MWLNECGGCTDAAIEAGQLTDSLVCLTAGIPSRITVDSGLLSRLQKLEDADQTPTDSGALTRSNRAHEAGGGGWFAGGAYLLGAGSKARLSAADIQAALAVGGGRGGGKGTPPLPSDEAMGPLGVVPGHAYALLGMWDVETADGKRTQLLQLRNPWGSGEYVRIVGACGVCAGPPLQCMSALVSGPGMKADLANSMPVSTLSIDLPCKLRQAGGG
eukprot:COSAG01_NODE_10123_length_2244_cov_1.421445_3_plen_216_part_00